MSKRRATERVWMIEIIRLTSDHHTICLTEASKANAIQVAKALIADDYFDRFTADQWDFVAVERYRVGDVTEETS